MVMGYGKYNERDVGYYKSLVEGVQFRQICGVIGSVGREYLSKGSKEQIVECFKGKLGQEVVRKIEWCCLVGDEVAERGGVSFKVFC